MCDPLTIVGVALTAGSTVANSLAANKAKKARSKVLEAERIRQRALDVEAEGFNVGARERYRDFPGQQERKAQELGDYFAGQEIAPAAAVEPGAPGGLPATTDIVVQEEAKEAARAKAFTDTQAGAYGNLRAFGDVLGGISRLQARDAGSIAQIGGFKRGSSDVVPFELDVANEAGAGLKQLGDVLNLAGSASLGAGLSGGSLPGWMGGGTAPVVSTIAKSVKDPWAGIRLGSGLTRPRSVAELGLRGLYGGPR